MTSKREVAQVTLIPLPGCEKTSAEQVRLAALCTQCCADLARFLGEVVNTQRSFDNLFAR